MTQKSHLAAEALNTLHGARELPPKEAAAVLRPHLNAIGSGNGDARDAAKGALKGLIDDLEVKGAASNDDWQLAIETMVTLANQSA